MGAPGVYHDITELVSSNTYYLLILDFSIGTTHRFFAIFFELTIFTEKH